jgi:hypothetical protein
MNGLYHLFILQVTFGMLRCEILMTQMLKKYTTPLQPSDNNCLQWHHDLLL